ncbi:MAG: hypothetical protein E6Q95_03670 [Chitinophagaceae bacterium]|nr:MAG: hypothetical protein E6Q95_03670 [Chitinophagaceae bacterium]
MRLFYCYILFVLIGFQVQAQPNALERELSKRIFIKQHVSKPILPLGSSIAITYELYSAIPSKAEIIKQPSLSRFKVNEIINPSNNRYRFVDIGGTQYTVHVFKKLILTPIDTGKIWIDSFSILNKVNLQNDDGNVYPWVIQSGSNLHLSPDGWYEFSMHTNPILIEVLPATSSSSTQFEGVSGDFKIEISNSMDSAIVGGKGQINISFTGSGEFDKIKLPFIDFGHQIAIDDTLIHQKTDSIFYSDTTIVNGYKQFVLSVNYLKSGAFTIPGFDFTFYNPYLNQIITTHAHPRVLQVYNKEITVESIEKDTEDFFTNKNILLILSGVLLFLLLTILAVYRKKKKIAIPVHHPIEDIQQHLSIAQAEVYGIDQVFFIHLKKALLMALAHQYSISDTKNQEQLKKDLFNKNVSNEQSNQIIQSLIQLETHIYNNNIDHQYRKKVLFDIDSLIKNILIK